MKPLWYKTAIALCLGTSLGLAPLNAQLRISVRDAQGTELRKLPGVTVSEGYVVVSRSGLLGAASADTVTGAVAQLAAEDVDADLALLAVPGARDTGLFAGDDVQPVTTLAGAGFAALVEKVVPVPTFGDLYRLKSEKNHPVSGSPLWNERGEVSAWFLPKTVDGQRFSFAIPVHRLLCLAPRNAIPLAQWAQKQRDAAATSFSLAMGYFWIQDFDGAAYHFREATRHNADDPRAWFYLAFSQGKMGRTKEKLESYRRAAALAPTWGELHFNLGFGYLLTGEEHRALEESGLLAELDPLMAERLQAYVRTVHIDRLPEKRDNRMPSAPK